MPRPRPLTDESSIVVGWRTLILLTAVLAEVWNIVVMLQDRESPFEHFAYFTIQANLLAIAVVAWMLLEPARRRPSWFDSVRGAMTAYMILTGIIYAVLVSKPEEVWSWQIEFSNAAQHRFLPVALGLDWLLVPPRRPIRLRQAATWMLYPLAFLAATWLRGGLLDGWFPYPFLDPTEHGGWSGLLLPVGQVLLGFIAVIAIVAAVSRVSWRSRGGGSSERASP